MRITLNNLELPSNLITFTDIPNILKVEDDGGGTYASITFEFENDLSEYTTNNGQWYISLWGETVTNVLNPDDAINRNFFVSSSNQSTAASLCRALRNCPTVATNFNVINNGNEVVLTAKAIGTLFSNSSDFLKYNIWQPLLWVTLVDGSANSNLYGAKIDVDVYNGTEYITTLEKNYYGSDVAYNISPVLSTFAEYGNALPYTLKVSTIVNGNYSLLGTVPTNYISVGYMVNQGNKYLYNSDTNIAQNFSRGTNRDVLNNTILYIYHPVVPISFYNGNSGGMTIRVDYLDSAYQVLSSTTSNWRNTDSSKKLWDLNLQLDSTLFNQSFYIDVTLGTKTVRYNVIKPMKATEFNQRILWRNSYGGISFFDFTGQKAETRELELTTYEKNIFDYYQDPINELEKVYNNDVKYTVTLKSHLFEKDGKYIFNDILQSAKVWTNINGQDYAIIIDSVSVAETSNNDIYECTFKYKYSQEPSLI